MLCVYRHKSQQPDFSVLNFYDPLTTFFLFTILSSQDSQIASSIIKCKITPICDQ